MSVPIPPVAPVADADLTRLDVEPSEVRLLDLGCGVGGSLKSAERRFGVRGVGIDLLPQKVRKARAAGLRAVQGDICKLSPCDYPDVLYVNIDNVLEHLPSLDVVEDVLASACGLAERVVHIRHPSFEDEHYLAGLGFKQYWTDWPGQHTAHVLIHEFMAMASRIGVYHVVVRPVRRAVDSTDATILPIDAPSGQRKRGQSDGAIGAYDRDVHSAKEVVAFDRPVYFAFDISLVVGSGDARFTYRTDPETSPGRPFVTWVPFEPPPFAGPLATFARVMRRYRS